MVERKKEAPRSSTQPPPNYGKVSGRYRMPSRIRTYFTSIPPEQRRNPSTGGVILNEFQEWTSLDEKMKEAVREAMLEFNAQDPMPADEEIAAEIQRQINAAGPKLAVKEVIAGRTDLPDTIRTAIREQMEEEIANNPGMSEKLACEMTRTVLELAAAQLKEEESRETAFQRLVRPKASRTLKYAFVAQSVLSRMGEVREKVESIAPESMQAPRPRFSTIPDAPDAMRDKLKNTPK